jgi:hypothetical protein
MALREWAWRNGWFLSRARTPLHVAWLRRAGVGPEYLGPPEEGDGDALGGAGAWEARMAMRAPDGGSSDDDGGASEEVDGAEEDSAGSDCGGGAAAAADAGGPSEAGALEGGTSSPEGPPRGA